MIATTNVIEEPVEEVAAAPRGGRGTPKNLVVEIMIAFFNGLPAHRRLALPRSVRHWSLTRLREKLIKIGAKVIRHSRYVTFQMPEVAVPRELSAAILDRTQQFGAQPPLVRLG